MRSAALVGLVRGWSGAGGGGGGILAGMSGSGWPQGGVEKVVLDGGAVGWELLSRVYGRRVEVEIAPEAVARMERASEAVARLARGAEAVYGINTGFGSLCTVRIGAEAVERLQENLVRSHAVGVGPAMPAALVRLMMLLKLVALVRGYSGIRVETARLLAGMLSADILPVIPTQGSVGASGDLAPLAHMALALIGEGEVEVGGERCGAGEALARAGLKPVRLAPKEGLALVNGTQFSCAYGVGLVLRGRGLARAADVVACMSLEAIRGSVRPFSEALHALRPHPGAQRVAANIRSMMRESEILESHRTCGKVQDPYSVRCVAAVHGASREAIEYAAEVVLREANSVTDNPVILEDGEAVSGGNFHGQPLGLALDHLGLALAELGSISERRSYLLLTGPDGLPPLLIRESGLNSGFMLLQYTAAALVSENKVLSHPASADSIPTSLGQEDHVSMSATAATKAWRIADNVETVLAVELLCAGQGLDFRAPLKPGIGPRAAHAWLRGRVEHVEADRLLQADLALAREGIAGGEVVAAVEAACGPII